MKASLALLSLLTAFTSHSLKSPAVPPTVVQIQANTNLAIADGARQQIGSTLFYDPAYMQLTYPGGDVPQERGVCSDVVIRALRSQKVDLQKLVHEDMTKILTCVHEYFLKRNVSYYKKMQHTGYLRHLLLRRGVTTGEILVHVITTSQEEHNLESLKEELLALPLEGKIVGIMHIINDSLSDVVQSDETRILYGQDFFYETLLGLRFKISTFSFFQPNSLAAEVLYSVVRQYIGDTKDKVVFDLYSGTGTIAQLAASVADEVIGVEIVEEAVEAAKENAALNNLGNCKFIAGDVLKVLDDLTDKPDVIILDPPRDGIHPKALPKILSYGVDHIVYISCKATSLARDLPAFLAAGYKVEKACCVDQFCQTVHVETVVLLQRKNM